MKNKLYAGKYRITGILAGFVLILVIVGILMQFKMQELLRGHIEKQVSEQAIVLSNLLEEKLELELKELDSISEYIQSGISDGESILAVSAPEESGISAGVLDLNGNTIYGDPIAFSDFPELQNSFRGNDTVTYNKEKGLLFAVPIYNGTNVKYVLYRIYSKELLPGRFGFSCYEEQGRMLLVDRDDQIILSMDNWSDEQLALFQSRQAAEVFEIIKEKMNIAIAASGFCKGESGNYYLFLSEIDRTDLRLAGMVPEEVVSEGVSSIIALVLWVFGLLLLLLAIGTAFLFGAEEKARESEELRKAKIMADTANRAKSDFLANMSHEIRTPINAIMGMNEMVIRESKDEAIKSYAFNIQNASQTLLSLINDILDFSKIEAGRLELVDAPYDVSALLHDVVSMTRIKADQKNLDFQVEVDDALPSELCGDETRIRQILINLLGNGVKYTKEGKICLHISYEQTDASHIVMKACVKDTGIGIRQEDMRKLFDDFERLDIKKNRDVEGTGLGLAITKDLVEQMKGKLEVQSVYGEGSAFTVMLPQKVINANGVGNFEESFQAYMKKVHVKEKSFLAPDARILVVDDNEMNLLVVENLLKRTKARITTCLSGQQCLELTKANHFDMILLDHMMPEMDGIETLKRMKESKESKCIDTPVIALTANAIAGSREMYIGAGFADYLSKPIDVSALEEMLHRHLPEKLVLIQTGHEAELIVEEREKEEPRPEKIEELLDCSIGMRYCGNQKEAYQEILKAYYRQGQKYMQELPICYEKRNWADYTVITHAIKSTSMTIGAKHLSEMAREQEAAAKNGNEKLLDQKQPVFFETYCRVLERISQLIEKRDEPEKKEEEKQTISLEEFVAMTEDLLNSVKNFDIDEALEQIASLQRLETVEPEGMECKELLRQTKTALEDFDYTEAEYLLTEWVKKVENRNNR